jgi:hypothetical protein
MMFLLGFVQSSDDQPEHGVAEAFLGEGFPGRDLLHQMLSQLNGFPHSHLGSLLPYGFLNCYDSLAAAGVSILVWLARLIWWSSNI